MAVRLIKLLHPNAKMPVKVHAQDAGYDHFLCEDITLEPRECIRFPLGIAVEIKTGQMLSVRSRSSTKLKGVSCSQTTCDAGYNGELYGFLINHTDNRITWNAGDRVVQLVFLKLPEPYVLTELAPQENLPPSSRNTAGFGSTGN